jgi:tetratricopeptide (TPR) repeat protein
MQSIKASPKIWMVLGPVIMVCSAKTIDRNRDWATDIKLFSNDVKNYPNSVHLLFYMGNHPWWAEPREVVDEQFEALGISSAVAKDSSNKESTLVIHYLSKAYTIYPELPAESYFYLGRAYNNMQRYDSAMFFLTKSLTRFSTVQTESYYQLGLAYKNTNNLDSAYRYLSLACQGDPTNSTYLNNLGILYCTMSRPAEALPLFKKAHEHSPEFTDFMNNIGAVYGNLGQTDSAIYWFEKAITEDPQNTVALNFLELTWRNRGNLVLADQYKRRAEEAMAGRKVLTTY